MGVACCAQGGGWLTRTTHCRVSGNTRVVSVGVNYPTGGIYHGLTKSTLLRSRSLITHLLSTTMGDIGTPIALGAHLNFRGNHRGVLHITGQTRRTNVTTVTVRKHAHRSVCANRTHCRLVHRIGRDIDVPIVTGNSVSDTRGTRHICRLANYSTIVVKQTTRKRP